MTVDWVAAQRKAAQTGRWAVTMKSAYPASTGAYFLAVGDPLRSRRWRAGGVVDLIAIRKDYGKPLVGTKRGGGFQIILIQVEGGRAAMPTTEDGHRLRAVARHHRARQVLLAGTTSAASSWAGEFSTRKRLTMAGLCNTVR
jgi:hypothetical protein